jgi:hypothetical protein
MKKKEYNIRRCLHLFILSLSLSLSAEISLEVMIVTTENLSMVHIILTIEAGILKQP